jgi:hypothetical protein
VLLRESYRDGPKVCKRTLANLSSLSSAQVEAIRATLAGQPLQPAAQALAPAFEAIASPAHGHVMALTLTLQRLGLADLLSTQRCRERDLVLAMLGARILSPHTKLATTRWWHTTTLAQEFGVADADEDDLYAAMDWLFARQDAIQAKLAARHLREDGLVLYDLSSSYFEGTCCPLAKLGYNRDGKSGLLQVNYGLLTDARGCPVAVSVYEGNVSDAKTLMPEVKRLRENFGIKRFVLVGDRGMISSKAIDELRQTDGIGWITALKSVSIRALMEKDQCKRSANPSTAEAAKLRTLRWCDGRTQRGGDGQSRDGAPPGTGGGISGVWAEGHGMVAGQWRAIAHAGELVRACAALACAA